jgi:flavodoxin short chain
VRPLFGNLNTVRKIIMSKVLIVYGSTTGNTESVSDAIAKFFENNGLNVEIRNAADVAVENMADGFDAVLLGSSTWGDDEIELQDDFVQVYDNLDKAGLGGRKVAVFGCGDSSYEHFCGAVDALEERAGELGADIIGDTLKIDGDPDLNEAAAWAETILAKL